MPAATALRRARTSLRRLLRPHRMDLVYSAASTVRIDGVQFDPERGERILTFLLAEGLAGWRKLLRPEPATRDPRVVGGGEAFDAYPYFGGGPKHPSWAGRRP